MEGNYHKTGLYRWQRQAKPRVYSRTQKITSTDDIQDWLQKVEDASSKAAETVLGQELSSQSPYTMGRQRGCATIRDVSEQARIQDEAWNEAQDLLNEWLMEKVSLHEKNPDAEEGEPDPWRKEDLGSKARREWDNLLNGNLEELGINTTIPRVPQRLHEDDPYGNLYDLDEREAVSAVMRTMLSKELVKEPFRSNLGFEDPGKGHDPRTKMELRHQRVKENRERREKEQKRRRREADTQKQARLTAQHIVMKEQKEKELKVKREEQEIKKQMVQIRKEMQEARKQQSEERMRKQEEEEETARLAREELNRQQAVEREEKLRKEEEASDRRTAQLAHRQLEKATQTAHNLRVLHRYFTAWYDVVLYRRLCFGKARALADWRLTLRVWNGWRSHTRSQRVFMETRQHQINVVNENRKVVQAQKHHYLRQLRRHFMAWQDFVAQEKDRRELEQAQESTRTKMMNLLSAVAEGALKSGREDEIGRGGMKDRGRNRGRNKENKGATQNPRGGPTTPDLDEMFSQPAASCMTWEAQSDTSSHPDTVFSNTSTTQCKGQGHEGQRAPSQAWQITRSHTQLSKQELARIMQCGDQPSLEREQSEVSTWTQHSDAKIRKRFGTQPWMKRHYVVNNLEHRFSAQQKLLREQQTALREQQRMIEELRYTHSQQQHHNTLALISTAAATGQPLPEEIQVLVADAECDGHERKTLREKAWAAPSPRKNTERGRDTDRSDMSSAVTEPCTSEVTSASTVTTGTNSAKYLRILKSMEERAAERTRLKAEREEKRRRAQEEHLERLKAEEEHLKKQAEEEKLARVQAFREKKRQQKQKEQNKQREMERQRELNHKADVHYQRAVLRFHGLLPMKKLVLMTREKMDTAQRHHNHHILRKTMAVWQGHTGEVTAGKKQLADELHAYIVVRRCFQSWKNFKYRILFMERRAERHYGDVLLPKLFEAWCMYTAQEKVEEQQKLQQALDFYPRSLVKKVFRAWRRLPHELKREAEREKLRAEMRKKVADLLPDFTPSVTVRQSSDSMQCS